MLSHQELGKGPAVVLLHGFPLNSSIWNPQKQHLSQRFRVILPDLPGHGASAPQAGASIADMAREVLSLLDSLGVQQAAVGGHSMGGYVALALQKLAPARVTGLALISTQAGDDSPEARQGRISLAEKVGQEGPDPVVHAVLPKLFATADERGPAQLMTANMIRQTPREGIQAALQAMAGREDLRPHLTAITVPTLVLTGQEDRLIPPDRSEGMAAQIANAVLVKVADAGHMPMMEKPNDVSRALERWLDLVY